MNQITIVMKVVLMIISALLISGYGFTQMHASSQKQMMQDYLSKSKSQHTLAWILTVGGGGMMIAGTVMISSDQSYFPGEEVGTALLIGGALSATSGIILFNASKKNRQKAEKAGLVLKLKMEQVKYLQYNAFRNTSYPAVSFSLRAR